MLKGKCIGIVGCGNMGEAIIRGLLSKKVVPKSRIIANDVRNSRTVYLKHKYGIREADNLEVAKKSHILILAVKPQDLDKALNTMYSSLSSGKLLISILAGTNIDRIKELSKRGVQIARVMPNMGALVGESMSALSFGANVKPEHKRMAFRIFSSLGDAVEVKEDQMDAITAISGSGPAYFFYLVEALINSAVNLGIEKRIAERLAIKTAVGSAKLLAQIKQTPQILREKITSKGGTTEAALKVFNDKKFEHIVKEAINAALNKSKQLSGGK